MNKDDIYTLVVRSDDVGNSQNSGTRVNGIYRVLFQSFLPNKYTKYLVKCSFKTNYTNAVDTAKTIIINCNLGSPLSYDTQNNSRTTVLGVAEKIMQYNGASYKACHILRYDDSFPVVVDNPNESFLNIFLTGTDNVVLTNNTDLDQEFILTMTFKGIE